MEIPLRHGTVLVDDEDASKIRGYNWGSLEVGGRVYVRAWCPDRRKGVYMHHLILDYQPKGRGGGDIDHLNGNGLDNRRSNLRLATRQQNNGNSGSRRGSSKYKGVSWNRTSRAWQAHIMSDYKSCYLGLYDSEEDAARAYDLAAVDVFGEFARLNLPEHLHELPPRRRTRGKYRKRDE